MFSKSPSAIWSSSTSTSGHSASIERFETRRVADVHQSEVVFGAAGLQAQFTGLALDVSHMQSSAAGRMENAGQQVAINRVGIALPSLELLEAALENVAPAWSSIPLRPSRTRAMAFCTQPRGFRKKSVQEPDDGQDVRVFRLLVVLGLVDRAPHEDPQRVRQVIAEHRFRAGPGTSASARRTPRGWPGEAFRSARARFPFAGSGPRTPCRSRRRRSTCRSNRTRRPCRTRG